MVCVAIPLCHSIYLPAHLPTGTGTRVIAKECGRTRVGPSGMVGCLNGMLMETP